jgi:uncharacterized protein YegP (UPF0339 family)
MFMLSQGRTASPTSHCSPKNKQVVLTSEMYGTRAAAVTGIALVEKNATERERFETRTARNGKSYFVLTAKNGKVIGQSQIYPTAVQRTRASDR